MRASVDWIEALVHSELDTAACSGRGTAGAPASDSAVAPVREIIAMAAGRLTLTGTFEQDRRSRSREARLQWLQMAMPPCVNGRARLMYAVPISAGPRLSPMR